MSDDMAEQVKTENAECCSDEHIEQVENVEEQKKQHHKKHSVKDEYNEKIKAFSQEELHKECVDEYLKIHDLEKEIDRLKKSVEEKEKESLDYLDRYRRSLAEVENVRRRVQNDKQENLKYANFNIISDLLTILDDFERALEHSKTENTSIDAFAQGIEMIEKQFSDLLFKKFGVDKYGTSGEDFDPNIHQAVMMDQGEFEKETILEVFRKGYKLHERVIRPAQVKIGKPL